MSTYQVLKEKTIIQLDKTIAFTKHLAKDSLVAELQIAKDRLHSDTLTVVVAGECKRGKSSLVNNLLEEVICPVNAAITTCLVSTIQYAPQEKVNVHIKQDDAEEIETIGRSEIQQYATQQENPNNRKNVARIDIQIPNPRLSDGIVFVDTPGVGGLNASHTSATYTFIPNADTVLYVCDATSPLSNSELEFIKRVARDCSNLIFVITRKDQVSDLESVVSENRSKLAKTLSKSPESLTIIPVSNLAKENYLLDRDVEDLKDSNFEELENTLWKFLQRERGRIILSRAIASMVQAIMALKIPLERELDVCSSQNQALIEQQRADLNAKYQYRLSLMSNRAEWQTKLNLGISKIKINTQHRMRSGFTAVHTTMQQYVKDRQLQGRPDEIAALLAAEITALMSQIDHSLNEQAGTLYQELIQDTGLGLTFSEYRSSGDVDFDDSVSLESRQGLLSKVFTVARQATFNGTVGGGIGSLFPGPGTVIGAVVGLIHGLFDGIKQIQTNDRNFTAQQLTNHFRPQLTQAQNDCDRNIQLTLANMETDIREEFRVQVEREIRICDESIAAMDKAQKASAEEAKKRAMEIQRLLAQLKELYLAIQAIAGQLNH
ncbi:hypothetical protein GTO89_02695 [Heliobacterium gestii]|uniref:Dynamin N-terminal domain-containing protein n=1 Tax=Heliomicrobium gestii TaxID=2699 RepID=A0A845L5Q0_HELGE|nr:dynamin family protein [Heliomicrobium gestii]MBM7865693.1 GTPase Era involved in 16S rRNA processing [Heliomicrobium gestii]MZP41942.1 hypothetical protein [Heliomicrobium gestii]